MLSTATIYIDEAGRWPLAWPMYVGLILPLKKLSAKEVSRFRDSKKLSERQREECFTAIQQLQEKGKLIAFSAFATVQEIDKYGMTNAEHMAIVRGLRIILNNPLLTSFAVPLTGDKTVKNGSFIECVLSPCQGRGRSEATEEGLSNVHLVIDGKSDFNLQKIYPSLEITTIIHGDDKVKEIWMASIIAKVSRDRVMDALPKRYQKYGFLQHKGYGTKLHKEKIAEYGPSDLHRKLFLKWLFPDHKVQRKLPKNF